MWRACRQQPPILGCSARGLVLRGGKKKRNMCSLCVYMRVCSLEHFYCQVSAVPICSSHGASWTYSAINQSPAMAECLQIHIQDTHTHTHSHSCAYTNLWQLPVQRKTKATRDFIKRLQLLCTWARSKKDSFPRFNRQQVVLLRHFLSFSACHTLLIAIWRT